MLNDYASLANPGHFGLRNNIPHGSMTPDKILVVVFFVFIGHLHGEISCDLVGVTTFQKRQGRAY